MSTLKEIYENSDKNTNPRIVDRTPFSEDESLQIDKKGLYFTSNVYKFGTNYSSLKSDTETFLEQETSGIRIRSAVELNNPLIYGNEAIRIANRSTLSVEKMKQATGGAAGDGGLIGQGLAAITGGGFGETVFGGQVNSLSEARDGFNSKLGIPSTLIPTSVYNTGELQKGKEPDTMITLSRIRKNESGTELGKTLKQSGGGNFKTLGKQLLGQGISLGKGLIRDTMFGVTQGLGLNTPANGSYEYSSQRSYSDVINDVKTNEEASKKLNLPSADDIEEKKKAVIKKLESKLPLGKKKEKIEYSENNKYSKNQNDTLVVKDSVETNLDSPTEEENKQKVQDTINSQQDKKPIGETVEKKEYNNESKYSKQTKEAELNEDVSNYQRIDLSLVSPVRGLDRKITDGRYGKTEYAFRDSRYPAGGLSADSPAEGDNYSSKQSYTLEKIGLTSSNGDRINIMGIPSNGTYTDGVNTATKDEMEKSDLIPFWVSGLDSSSPVFFRTLITGLSETVTPSWSGNKFVGNPYNYYTYGGVERNVTFNLKLYCMNQAELMKNWERVSFLTSKAYPNIKNNIVNPPFIKFRLGDIYNNKIGFIESLNYTMPDNGVWETEIDGSLLPKFIDASITIKFVEVPGSELSLYSYQKSEEAIQGIKQTFDPAPEGGEFGDANFNDPNFNTRAVGNGAPVVIDPKTGNLLDSNDSIEPNGDKSKKGAKNLTTGKTESTPSQNNKAISDGPALVSLSSNTNSTYSERLTKIRQTVTELDGATKLAKRYSANSGLQLLELKKEGEAKYYIKEFVPKKSQEREFLYYQSSSIGNLGREVRTWPFMSWAKYQKSKKGNDTAMVGDDLLGEQF